MWAQPYRFPPPLQRGREFVKDRGTCPDGIDNIVNNAGYTWDSVIWDGVIQKMTDEQFQAILDVHLTAPFRILPAASLILSRSA